MKQLFCFVVYSKSEKGFGKEKRMQNIKREKKMTFHTVLKPKMWHLCLSSIAATSAAMIS